jgi:hypothetical protein
MAHVSKLSTIHYKAKSKSIKTKENSFKIDPFNEYNHSKIQQKDDVGT